MPLLCFERSDSRSSLVALDAVNTSIEGHWTVLGVDEDGAWDTTAGTEDDSLIRSQVEGFLPLTYLGLWFVNYSLEHRGNKIWDVRARYAVRPPRRPDSGTAGGWDTPNETSQLVPSYYFDTVATTEHVLRGKMTMASYRRGGAPEPIPDFKRHVNVNGESVEGVDIYGKRFEFTETHYFTEEQMTPSFRRNLFALSTTTNNATFRGFDRGEVLFLGASGSKKGLTHWEVTFKFVASPNVEITDLVGFPAISKWGWEYLWIRYVDTVGDGNVLNVKQAQYAYVMRMYDEGNFGLLNIGTF